MVLVILCLLSISPQAPPPGQPCLVSLIIARTQASCSLDYMHQINLPALPLYTPGGV